MCKNNLYCLAVCLFVSILPCHSQEESVDSLRKLLKRESDPARRADIFSEISWAYYGVFNDSALYYARKMNGEAIKTTNTKLEGNSYRFIGMAYERLSDYPNALKYQQEALGLFKKIKYKEGIANVYNNIGNIYQHIKEYELALEYQEKALKLCYELKITPGIAACLGNLGNIHNHLKNTDTALVYYHKSLDLDRQMGQPAGEANSLSNIGKIFFEKGNFPEARKYFEACFTIRKKEGISEGMASVLNFLGQIALAENDPVKASSFFNEAIDLAVESSSIDAQQQAYQGLYEASKVQGMTAEALKYHEMSTRLNDSIYNSSLSEEINKIKTSYALDQQEMRLREQSDRKQREEEKKRMRLRIINMAVIIGIILIAIFSWFIFSRYRHSQRQRVIIETQKQEVEEKNKQITDSIRYAKTIQQALMPLEDEFCRQLGNAFLFFSPRDIVSGDFYWMAATQPGSPLCFAIADCTGHGVPGGFMSVLGASALNEIVNERNIRQPAQALNHLRELVRTALGGHENDNKARDGMDISFFRMENDTGKLHFAGANSHIYILRKQEILTYQGDKMPIGYFLVNQPFAQTEIQLQPGDMVYAFTDGYADQFGGKTGKKFMYSRLKTLLQQIAGMTIAEQRQAVMDSFSHWKGNEEQVDDVCLLGFRYQ